MRELLYSVHRFFFHVQLSRCFLVVRPPGVAAGESLARTGGEKAFVLLCTFFHWLFLLVRHCWWGDGRGEGGSVKVAFKVGLR